jgi:hypothetical protein
LKVWNLVCNPIAHLLKGNGAREMEDAGSKCESPSEYIREFAVEPPGATRWLIRHAVLGGYVIWWLKWHGENFC